MFNSDENKIDELERNLMNTYSKNPMEADVAPVVHGKWIRDGNYHAWVCSRCGRGISNNPEGIDLYCYHCGAKMDERE